MKVKFPAHYDLCLRCREKGLDKVADFIHKLVTDSATLDDRHDELLKRYVE